MKSCTTSADPPDLTIVPPNLVVYTTCFFLARQKEQKSHAEKFYSRFFNLGRPSDRPQRRSTVPPFFCIYAFSFYFYPVWLRMHFHRHNAVSSREKGERLIFASLNEICETETPEEKRNWQDDKSKEDLLEHTHKKKVRFPVKDNK